MTVSVVGLGPMGQALAGALLTANHAVTVWNRTEAKADALRARGAVWADTPGAAIGASDVTLVNVVDHAVVDVLLGEAGDAITGRVIVGLSSDIPDAARRTAEYVAARGGRYLDGAIMTPTDTIGTADASILFAGPRDIFDAYRPVFDTLATASWVGADVGRAAAFDMALLDLFWTSVSGLVHALSVARANGIAPTELLPHANGIAAILPPIFGEIAERVEAGPPRRGQCAGVVGGRLGPASDRGVPLGRGRCRRAGSVPGLRRRGRGRRPRRGRDKPDRSHEPVGHVARHIGI